VPYSDAIIGAAIFDLNGLPKEYFTTATTADVSWVQTIFQVLGLQSLLVSSFKLDGFRHANIRGLEYQAIVVRQKSCHVALLLLPELNIWSEEFRLWMQDFDPQLLKGHPRFTTL
jgi:hypothetical protein